MNELETKSPPTKASKGKRRAPKFLNPLIVVVVLLAVGYGIWQIISKPSGTQATSASETRVVAVVKTVREDLQTEATLQAEFVPYQDIAVHAKVSGYVNMIRVDIGDQVKQGDLLATLEI